MEQRGRVLIVDDNALNVDVLRRILRKDYELETADNGDACLAKVSAFKPELVLLDIMMPGIDGYETCRRIKSGPLGNFVQVILVSGKGTTADRVHGYEALADDYVVKPFDHEELLSKVRAHFRLRKMQTDRECVSAHEALAEFCSLVRQMIGDIGEHSHLIEEIQGELFASEAPSPDAIIQAMVRLADINKATQGRLALAERKLREEAQTIESHASEARTDVLTLLPNRRAFDEELARRIAEADRCGGHFCAVMIDVDRFKTFNDKYGHPAGDEALRILGWALGRTMRQMDLVARYGGDEFAAIMPATSLDDAESGATRIREAIEKSVVHFEGQTLRITVSIGLAQRLPGEDGLSLIKRADKALYASKQAGCNCVHRHDGKQSYPAADGWTSPLVAHPAASGSTVTLSPSTV